VIRAAFVALGVAVALGGLWLWRELHTRPTETVRPTVGASASDGVARTRPTPLDGVTPGAADDSSAAGPRRPDELPPPLGGERGWTTAPAPPGGPDPFAPVTTIRTEADTRVGLDP
jgi:hypothetical protein